MEMSKGFCVCVCPFSVAGSAMPGNKEISLRIDYVGYGRESNNVNLEVDLKVVSSKEQSRIL